jgi:hypothetical protein
LTQIAGYDSCLETQIFKEQQVHPDIYRSFWKTVMMENDNWSKTGKGTNTATEKTAVVIL